MLPRGRPPGPGTAEEKAAIRREKVRLNVKAYRERKKNALAASKVTAASPSTSEVVPQQSSRAVSNSSGAEDSTEHSNPSDDQSHTDDEHQQVALRPKPLEYISLKLRQTESKRLHQQKAPSLWAVPDSGPIFATGFLATFRTSFLPTTVFLPQQHQGHSSLVTPCSPWIMSAYNMAMYQDEGSLKSGILALGLILNGEEMGNQDLKVASLQMQRQALCQLRNDLGPLSSQRQPKRSGTSIIAPYLSCLAVTMFEMVQSGFSPVILQHLKALNSLIELLYFDPNVDRHMADMIIEDFGMLEMMFCLKYGHSSVLRGTRRRLGLRSREKGGISGPKKNASVYGDILDSVEELPALILQIRNFQTQVYPEKGCEELQLVVRKLFRIQGDLDVWNIQFEVQHGSIMLEESYLDQKSGEVGSRPRVRSYEHGAVGLFALNFHLNAINANVDATTLLSRSQKYQCMPLKPLPRPIGIEENSAVLDDVTCAAKLERPESSKLEEIKTYDQDGMMYDQVKNQRAKGRRILRQLLELMEQFLKVAHNITGQSLLFGPCDTVRATFDEEQARLKEDTQRLRTGDVEGIGRIDKYMKDLEEMRIMFRNVEAGMVQFDSGAKPET